MNSRVVVICQAACSHSQLELFFKTRGCPLWSKWALPTRLESLYFGFLGDATLTVADAATGEPLAGAVANITYGTATRVVSPPRLSATPSSSE